MKKLAMLMGLIAGLAVAQELTANQGSPGKRGPWPVILANTNDGGISATLNVYVTNNSGDGGTMPVSLISIANGIYDGGVLMTTPAQCAPTLLDGGNPDQVTSIGVTDGGTGVPVPATASVTRLWELICNSAENAGTPKIKCVTNGSTPTMGTSNPGQVLGVGDCFQYTTTASVKCIADTNLTAVTSYECL